MELSDNRRPVTSIKTFEEVAQMYVRYSERGYFLSDKPGEEAIWQRMIALRNALLDSEIAWRIKIGIDYIDAVDTVERHFWRAVEDAENYGGLPPTHLPRGTMTCAHPIVA